MAKLISYAQNFEDIMLWRALSHVSNGCYVDVGAQSPDKDSVSRMFYEHGWRGMHVEPAPQYAELLRKRRPDEIVLQAVVSDRPGVLQFFGIADTGLSTTDATIAKMHRAAGYQVAEMQMPAVTLDAVLKQVKNDEIHWLKIDVEGAEQRVIDGWTAARPMPWLLVIESTRPLSPEQSHERWEPAVIARGYKFVYFDGLNRFYVSDQHPELKAAFGAGPNVFDNFSLSPGSEFCALVNLKFHDLEETQRADHERWQAESAELTTQVEAAKREASRWWSAHEEVRDQMQARVIENERQQAEIAALAAQLDAGKQEAQRWWSAHEALRAQFDAALQEHNTALMRASERAQQEVAELAAQIDAGKHEAHRWWLAHEELREQLHAIEQSRSWRWTRPLRTARFRLAAGRVLRLKQTLRSLIIRSIKVVRAAPWLLRLLKPVLAKIPFVYGRLHALATHEGLYEGGGPLPEIELQPPVVLKGNEREHAAVYLDKRAARALVDLKQSRNGKAA